MMAQLGDSRSKRPGSLRLQIAVLLFPLLLFGCGKTLPPTSGGTPLGGTANDGTAKDGKTPTETKPGGASNVPPSPCGADPAWVTSPNEFDAKTFPAFDVVTNCDFHRWSCQTCLWLTSPEPGTNGRLVFEGFADPNDLFTSNGKGPGSVPYPGHTDPARPLKMLARVAKSQTTVSIKDVFQAGPGNKALIDQNGAIVYYSNHLNKAYWNFIVDKQFYDLKTLQADKTTDFPVGAIELKASWRIAQKKQEDGQWGKWLIENAEDRFHVIETTIPTVVVNEQRQIVTSPADPVAAKMALVGMHVVGVVQQHPEFIWATFEHVDNAPDKAKTPTNDGGPTGPWSFYKSGTPLAQTNQFDVNNPLAVVNVCLVNPQGGGSSVNPRQRHFKTPERRRSQRCSFAGASGFNATSSSFHTAA